MAQQQMSEETTPVEVPQATAAPRVRVTHVARVIQRLCARMEEGYGLVLVPGPGAGQEAAAVVAVAAVLLLAPLWHTS